MYKCRKCGLKFKTQTEWKNHEFDCVNYVMRQTNELEYLKEHFPNEIIEYSYEVKPEEFKDYEDIIHKSIHFRLHIKFNMGKVLEVTDKSEGLKAGHLNEADDIARYIHNELYGSKEFTAYEKAMIEFYSAS